MAIILDFNNTTTFLDTNRSERTDNSILQDNLISEESKHNQNKVKISELLIKFENDYIDTCAKNNVDMFKIDFPNGLGVSIHPACVYCFERKPNRTHHCRQCRRCVRKMDHHCAVLGSCIGFDNYKQFFVTIFYSHLLSIYSLMCSLSSLKFYFNEFQGSIYMLIYCFYIVLITIITVLLFWFFGYHMVYYF